MLTVRRCTPEDCYALAKDFRESDAEEVLASSNMTPLESLLDGLGSSLETFVAVCPGGIPRVIFGVTPNPQATFVGIVWMLCHKDIASFGKDVLRGAPEVLDRWSHRYAYLWNFVDQRNVMSQRWLSLLGFEFIREHPRFGYAEVPFIEFIRKSPYV